MATASSHSTQSPSSPKTIRNAITASARFSWAVSLKSIATPHSKRAFRFPRRKFPDKTKNAPTLPTPQGTSLRKCRLRSDADAPALRFNRPYKMSLDKTNRNQGFVLVKNKQASWLTRLSIAAGIALGGYGIIVLAAILRLLGSSGQGYVLPAIAAGFHGCSFVTSPIPGIFAYAFLMRQLEEDKLLGNKLLFPRIRAASRLLLLCCFGPVLHFSIRALLNN